MGKKRIIKKSGEELAKEKEIVEQAVAKEKETAVLAPAQRIPEAIAHISSTYNNTIITITNPSGDTITWVSAGNIGFKGTKKSTSFAASKVAETAAERAKKRGIQRIHILVKGIGSGRESAIRSLATHGLDVVSIRDITPIPHGGVRPPKPRRV